jgi:integrase/recombinase XerC
LETLVNSYMTTAAHEWLAANGSETDLIRLMGWKSPQRLRRYGASMDDERVREAYRKLGLGDRLQGEPLSDCC